MAANMRLATATRNALADAITTLVDAAVGAGVIKIYTAAQPASANDAITDQTLLAEIPFADPSFGAAAAGVITADVDPVLEDAEANNTGTAAWARIVDGDGSTIFDCNVGTADATIILNTVSLVSGGPVQITAFTITMASGE
jgi:hypothetical protein